MYFVSMMNMLTFDFLSESSSLMFVIFSIYSQPVVRPLLLVTLRYPLLSILSFHVMFAEVIYHKTYYFIFLLILLGPLLP